MHTEVKQFCEGVKARFPGLFLGKRLLDIGSGDINGNNRYLFDPMIEYLGVDVASGPNVDIVCPAHLLDRPSGYFDVVISTEAMEHDPHLHGTLRNMVRLLRSGGLLLLTCATVGRPEHGTRRTSPADSLGCLHHVTGFADHYHNVTEADVRSAIPIDAVFLWYGFETNAQHHDLYFFGIKR